MNAERPVSSDPRTSEPTTEKLGPFEGASPVGEGRDDAEERGGRRAERAGQQGERVGSPLSVPALIIVGVGALVACAFAAFAWGGLFPPAQLALVILGVVLAAAFGVAAVFFGRHSLALAAVLWLVAFLALAAPLSVMILADAGPGVIDRLLAGLIGLWWSGAAPAMVVSAIASLVAIARR